MGSSAARPQSSEDQISLQAARWVVLLSADSEEERVAARAGFEAWKRESANHARAAQRIEGFMVRVQSLRDGEEGSARAARAALNATVRPRAKPDRARATARALALALVMGLPSWLALQGHTPTRLMADLSAPTGQWTSSTLQDGTRLTLNSASAVNLEYSASRRTIKLVEGEVLVDVARDPGRPFWVETAHGGVRALGTRFVVRREDGATVVTMLESRALAQAARVPADAAPADPPNAVISAGQRARITADSVEMLPGIDPISVEDAWRRHQLVALDRPLSEVLDELNRHRPGTIRFDRQGLEGIKVSAVLPLDDTDRALQLLVTSLPALRVRTLTPYIVIVDASAAR
ncbi:MAG: FecR domain-containing protein [Acidovorax sp.]|nr:FecR domain-containing protein [Acidovorax sp.]